MDKVDVLIVGGGLTGSAAAWHLADEGAAVMVIEKGDLNAGASGQNAGSLHFQIERRFLEHGEELERQATRVVVLNRLAIDEWRRLAGVLGVDAEIVMDGGLMVAERDDEVRALERKTAREAELGLATRLIDGAEARRVAPYLSSSIRAAAWLADEGHANPRILTSALARRAAQTGARFLTHASVTGIERLHGGFSVEFEQQRQRRSVRADHVLVAAGAWSAKVGVMANLHLPVYPAGLMMNITERTSAFLPHLIQHVGKRLSMKQAHDGNVLIGGGYPSRLRRTDDGEFDLARAPVLVPANIVQNLSIAVSVVPAIRQLSLIRSWTGTVALTPDQLPLVGEVTSMPGFYVCAGGSGFTLGPLFARHLAAKMSGRPDDGEDAFGIFSPKRFDHLNGFMG